LYGKNKSYSENIIIMNQEAKSIQKSPMSAKLENMSKKSKKELTMSQRKAIRSKSKNKIKSSKKKQSRSRTPKKNMKPKSSQKMVKIESDKRITIGSSKGKKSSSKLEKEKEVIIINDEEKIEKDPKEKNEVEQSPVNDQIKEDVPEIRANDVNESSQIQDNLTQNPTQVIQNDQMTQSIINPKMLNEKKECSTDSKTKISKVPLLIHDKKTTSKSNGNFQNSEKMNDVSNQAIKSESKNNLSIDNISKLKLNQKSQKADNPNEGTPQQNLSSKIYNSDKKINSEQTRTSLDKKFKSESKKNATPACNVNEMVIENIFKNNSKKSIMELNNTDPVTLMRASPENDLELKTSLKDIKKNSKNSSSEPYSKLSK